MPEIILPEDVQNIISVLNGEGYEAYAVGGCIRDSLLGKEPADWDITTSAQPSVVKGLFRRTIDTGIRHGTVTVRLHGKGYEVTTFRIDGDYSDGRHPDSVSFTASLEEDLKRRDFTINAMAYCDASGLVDLFGGQEDLKRGLITCVGDPLQRFSEDALRMLRAVRFAARFGFSIDPATAEAIEEKAETLSKVSAERIREEVVKLLISDHPEMMRDLYTLGLTKVFLPEFDVCMETPQNTIHHLYSVGEHTIRVIENVPAERILRLAALFHDIGKPACRKTDDKGRDHFIGHPALGARMTEEIMERFRFDNETIRAVCRLVTYHDDRFAVTERNVRRSLSRVGAESYGGLLTLRRADVLAQSDYMREEKLSDIEKTREFVEIILEKKEALTVRDLAVGGNDLIAAGIPKGPELGAVMKELLAQVVDHPEMNEREVLLETAKKLHREGLLV